MAGRRAPGDDDLSRQRRKREARLLAEPVSGFSGLTVGDVVTSVMAANEESGGALDPQQFLSDRGHCGRTIQAVLAYVERHDHDRTARTDIGGVAP